RQGDLFAPIGERVDVVCANLPYLRADDVASLVGERTSLAYEPRIAVVAGSDGLDVIRRAVSDMDRVLAPGAAAFLECDPPQAKAVSALLEAAGLRTRVVQDLAGADVLPHDVEARRELPGDGEHERVGAERDAVPDGPPPRRDVAEREPANREEAANDDRTYAEDHVPLEDRGTERRPREEDI